MSTVTTLRRSASVASMAVEGGMDIGAARQLGGDISLVVADDHPSTVLAVRQLCENLLGVTPDRLATAQCSSDLLDLCAEPGAHPRIIVLDLVMPGDLKRAALVRAVRCADPQARVVVYTADESPFLFKAVTSAGAMAHVCKSSRVSALVDAILAVSEGHTYFDDRIDLDVLKQHPWGALTESEHAVLLAFCRGSGINEIMARTGRSYSTVTTHKYHGLQKLGLRDVAQLLPYIYDNGLICELDGA